MRLFNKVQSILLSLLMVMTIAQVNTGTVYADENSAVTLSVSTSELTVAGDPAKVKADVITDAFTETGDAAVVVSVEGDAATYENGELSPVKPGTVTVKAELTGETYQLAEGYSAAPVTKTVTVSWPTFANKQEALNYYQSLDEETASLFATDAANAQYFGEEEPASDVVAKVGDNEYTSLFDLLKAQGASATVKSATDKPTALASTVTYVKYTSNTSVVPSGFVVTGEGSNWTITLNDMEAFLYYGLIFNMSDAQVKWNADHGTSEEGGRFSPYWTTRTSTVVLNDNLDFDNITITNGFNIWYAFDGNGKTVKNLNVTASSYFAGFFNDYKPGAGSYVPADDNADPSVANLTLDNINVTNTDEYAGILLGRSNGDFNNVTIKNSSVNGKKRVGGICGYSYGDAIDCKVDNCEVTGTSSQVGGLFGGWFGETISGSNVNKTTVKGASEVGGLVGRVIDPEAKAEGTYSHTIKNSSTTGATVKIGENEPVNTVEKDTDSYLGTLIGQIYRQGEYKTTCAQENNTVGPAQEAHTHSYTTYTYESNKLYKNCSCREKVELTADEVKNFTGVNVQGINGHDTEVYATIADAYNALSALTIEKIGKDGNNENSNITTFYSDVTEKTNYKSVGITWNVWGAQTLGTGYVLTLGRKQGCMPNNYWLNDITVTGKNDSAKITASTITVPWSYQFSEIDDREDINLTIKNVTLEDTSTNGIVFDRIYDWSAIGLGGTATFTIENCKVNGGICESGGYQGDSVWNIKNNVFTYRNGGYKTNAFFVNGVGATDVAGGRNTVVNFIGNTVSGYDRATNFSWTGGTATIKNNTITPGAGYSAVQVSNGVGTVLVEGNTIHLNGGNVLTIHDSNAGKGEMAITVKNNTIDGRGYAVYDDVAAGSKTYGTGEGQANATLVWENNDCATMNTTKGIKGSSEKALSDYVYGVLNGRTINVTPETVQAALDAAKKGDTIVLGAGTYGTLYLRQTLENSTRRSDLDKDGSYPAYYREFKDITIKAADGATVNVAEIQAEAGLFWYSSAPASNQAGMNKANGGFVSYLALENIVIDGLNFTATDKSAIVLRDNGAVDTRSNILVDGLTIKKCTGTGTATNQSVHFFSAGAGTNDQYFPGTEKKAFNNIVIKDNELTSYYQPICMNNSSAVLNGLTVTGNKFTNCEDNQLQLSNKVNAGTFTISDNKFVGMNGRLTRITNAQNTFVFENNTITTPKGYDTGNDGSIVKITGTAGFTVTENNNEWTTGAFTSDAYTTWISNGDASKLAVYVAKIGSKGYETLAAALIAANSGDTIEILDGTWGADAIGTLDSAGSYTNANKVRYKSLTIKAAEGAHPVFTSQVYLGYDDSSTANATMTVKGLKFDGASLKISNYLTVDVEDCTFVNGTSNTAGVLVIQDAACKNHKTNETYPASQITIKNIKIDGSNDGASGIRLRNSGNVTIQNSEIKNSKFNGILFESNTSVDNTFAKAISITDNKITEWNSTNADGKGRGMRLALGTLASGSTVTVKDNYLTKATIGLDTPDFMKITDVGSGTVDISHNSWNDELLSTVKGNSAYYTSDVTATIASVITTKSEPVAQIGENKYTSLQAAVEAANQAETAQTIKLLDNVDLTTTQVISKNLTIDLNGKNITSTDARAIWVKEGTLTVTGTGTIAANKSENGTFASSSSVIRVGDNEGTAAGLVVGENVTVSSNNCYGITYFGTDTQTVTVNGAVNVTGTAAAMSGNGTSTYGEATVTVNGTVTAANEYAIYHPEAGTLTINGTVSGKGGVEMKGGKLVVNSGARVTATAESVSHETNNNGTSTSGYAIANVYNPNYKGNVVIEVKEGATVTGVQATINDYVAQIGTTKYETLAAAIDAANASETAVTIEILADCTADNTLTVSKSVTINGNNKKLTSSVVNKPVITVSDGEFTMMDLTVYASAKVGSSSNHPGILLNTNDKVTITGCTFDGIADAFYNIIEYGQPSKGAKVADGTTISNNTFNGAAATHNCINMFDYVENATVTINGNKFNNLDTSDTNAIRVSDYYSVAATINMTDDEYTYTTPVEDSTYAGFILVQNNQGSSENLTLNFNNLKVQNKVVTLNGTGTNDQVVYVYTSDNKVTYEGVKVTGIQMPVAKIVTDTSTTYFDTLADAIAAVPTDGTATTITMIADTTENVTVAEGQNITLNMVGHTLSGGSVATNGKKAAIVNNGTLTITSTSNTARGTIKREDDDTGLSTSNSYYTIDNQGTMTLKYVNVTNNAGCQEGHNGSSLIRNGEVNENASLSVTYSTLTQKNFNVIKNGSTDATVNLGYSTVVGEDGQLNYAILDYGMLNITAFSAKVYGPVSIRGYKDGDSHGAATLTGGYIYGTIYVEQYPGCPSDTKPSLTVNANSYVYIAGEIKTGTGNGKANGFTEDTTPGTNGSVTLNGGYYSVAPDASFVAEGKAVCGNNSVTYPYTIGTAVAQIGDVKYTSLYNAYKAVTGTDETTIKILESHKTDSFTVSGGKNIVLDLNGHKINAEGSTSSWVQVINNATLTIDGTKTGSAAYGRMNLGKAGNDNGNVVINGGTYSCGSEQTVLHINGECLNSNVTINGATISSADDNGIQLNGKGTFAITNTTINGATGIYIKAGTLTLTGSTITGNMTPVNYSYNGNGANPTGDGIVVDACEYPGGNPSITITNTTITGTKKAVGYYEYDANNDGVKGTATVIADVNTYSVPDGYKWAVNENGYKLAKAEIIIVNPEQQTNKTATVTTEVTVSISETKPANMPDTVKTKVDNNTTVTGVELTKPANETQTNTGLQKVIEAAKAKDEDVKEAVEAADKDIHVQVDVEVEAVAYDSTNNTISFTLNPVATVTVGEGSEKVETTVEVLNEWIDTNQNIKVEIYTGFNPAKIVHVADDGSSETFLKTGDKTFTYDAETGVATFNVTHFSSVTAYPELAANVYTVSVADATNGTVTVNKMTAEKDTEVTITTNPATGYKLATLVVKNGENVVDVNNGKFTMPEGDVTVTAKFAKETYVIGTHSEVGALQGGGQYYYGDKVNLIAGKVAGWTFEGWYLNGTKVSSDMAYEFTVSAAGDYIAKYTSTASFKLDVTGSYFSVNNKAQEDHYNKVHSASTSMTVKYTDANKTFLYWVNGSGNVVSTDATYTFALVGDTTLKAVATSNSNSGSAIVVFRNSFNRGQELLVNRYTVEDGETLDVEYPSIPSAYGRTFIKWAIGSESGEEATPENITAAIANGAKSVTIAPVYSSLNQYTIAVQKVAKSGNNYTNIGEAQGYLIDTGYTMNLTAAGVEGKVFSHWEDADHNVVGTNTEYKVSALANITIYEVYVEDASSKAEAVDTITTSASASIDGTKFKLTFSTLFSISDSKTVVKKGYLYSTTSTDLTYENRANLKMYEWDSVASNNDGMVLDLRTSDANRVLNIRPYVITSSGAVIYGDIISTSYNQLKGE